MDDEIINLAERRAAKEAKLNPGEPEFELEGYRISYSADGQVQFGFIVGDQEYVATMTRASARRFAIRGYIAAERARRCQTSQSSKP